MNVRGPSGNSTIILVLAPKPRLAHTRARWADVELPAIAKMGGGPVIHAENADRNKPMCA